MTHKEYIGNFETEKDKIVKLGCCEGLRKKTRVAIIGGGPSGFAQLRAFQKASKAAENIPEIVCFDKQANWGGLCNYAWQTGLYANGETCHASVYRYLWSKGPKECLESADYPLKNILENKSLLTYPDRFF